jgi:hypothetical protein
MSRPRRTAGDPVRITYLILAHQLPEQTVRLIRRLNAPGARFVLHWDGRSADADLRAILDAVGSEATVSTVRRHECYWGTFSIVAATLDGIAAACDAETFDRLVLLSGQDYPIKPTSTIRAFFEKEADRSFVHHVPLPKPDWPGDGWDRVELQWVHPASAPNGVLAPLSYDRRRFPAELTPHGGGQFWALTYPAATYVRDYSASHPDVVRFFEHVFAPDEIYIQTVLANSPLRETLANDTLHYVDWKRPGSILVGSDLDTLASTYHLFARKFDARADSRIFDLIDRRLLQDAVSPAHA